MKTKKKLINNNDKVKKQKIPKTEKKLEKNIEKKNIEKKI